MLRAWRPTVLTLALRTTSGHRTNSSKHELARAIAGAAMSSMTQDEIVELTGYTADRVLRICADAGVSGD